MVPDELPQATPGLDDFEALQKQLDDEQKKSADNLAGWQRSAADLVNFRKRTEQERNDLLKFGNTALILRILPVLDDFERAVATLPAGKQQEITWVDGFLLIHRKLQAILEAEGLKPIVALGQEFDPTRHEAVLQETVSDASLDGKVTGELQKGYTLNERVIRPTMVKVGQKA
jgi:molecular chaperone GrpE